MCGDFGLPKGVDPFVESTDDGEGQTAQLDDFSDGGFSRTVNLLRPLVGDQAYFSVGLLVFLIEETAGRDYQVAHAPVRRIHSENLNITLFALSDRYALF